MVLKKMMTGKRFGVFPNGNKFRVQFHLSSDMIHLSKSFALESNAIIQHHTWVNQLELDDGEKGVSRKGKKWCAARSGMKALCFKSKEEALVFRNRWVVDQFKKLKHDYQTRLALKLSALAL